MASCSSPKQPQEDKTMNETILPSVVEIITVPGSTPSIDKVKKVCREYNIDSSAVYRWGNRLVIYDIINKPEKLIADLTAFFGDGFVKYYDVPFYIFDRRNCDNKETVKDWSHTIMTANLVKDSVMQKEYMDYHATQAEAWPEVADGFCKAEFQQLLIFRNGRQLMLIISIPEGKKLDDLNPKTTENNPKVDEWNAIMSKYQEGIEGAEPGSAWVVFDKIK